MKRVEDTTHGNSIENLWIAPRQVSVGEFREFVTCTGYLTDCERREGGWVIAARKRWIRKPDACWDNPYMPQEEHDPVVLVSWHDAVTFANWKSAREALSAAYKIARAGDRRVELDPAAAGYRLPTELEWECAARAGIIELPPAAHTRKRKVSAAEGQGLPPGPWCSGGSGGRSFEWCWDSLGTDQDLEGSLPAMPARICRGAASDVNEDGKLPVCRGNCAPLAATSTLGFRLVKVANSRPS
jgi:formylglycine-generating enzyme required for sulfatase activity